MSSGACLAAAGQNRSKLLGSKRDAAAFDAELRCKRRTGELAALDAGEETLAEFGEEWWKLYAERNPAPTTLKVYAIPWDTHVLPRLAASARDHAGAFGEGGSPGVMRMGRGLGGGKLERVEQEQDGGDGG